MQTKNIQVKNIPVTDICTSDLNPRKTFDQESLMELAQNIKEHGLVQPITIRKRPKGSDTKYEIVCGERRYRATVLNGEEEIQCIVKELDDKQAFAAMIIENLQRKDVDPIEEAAALGKLYDNGSMTIQEIAKTLGKSTSFVLGRIQLNNIIPEFIDLMRDGTLYLVHLLSICRLTTEQQKIFYEECFTPSMQARRATRIILMDELKNMIDEHVMKYLDMAKFNTEDASFSCGRCCLDCPMNTKNQEAFKDSKRDRCMDRTCFAQKNLEFVLRQAKDSGFTPIYIGEGNEAIIEASKAQGIELIDANDRKYVFEPVMPDKAKFTDEEYYDKRMESYHRAKAVFDSNVDDGLIEKVFEVCYDGKLSGEVKWTFSVPKECEDKEAVVSKREQITKVKESLFKLKEQEHDEIIEEKRKLLESSSYSSLNTYLSKTESMLLHAILLKRLSYDFKKSIGIEWNNSEDAFKKAVESGVLEKNLSSIKREFIKEFLSDKSVCYAHDLAGMLNALLEENNGSSDDVEKKVHEKYAKQRETLKAKLDELNGKKNEPEAETPEA